MALSTFLREAGYQQVALTRSAVGHFHTGGTLNGRRVDVLLDMGAASTVVSLAVGAGAWDYTQQTRPDRRCEPRDSRARRCELSLGEVQPRPRALLAMDLTHVNQSLALKGEAPVDAILGADVFEAQAAVIDYGSSSLFLKP